MALIINNSQFPIQTVAPAINIGELMIEADRRSSKDTKLTDAERIRRIVLPAGHWQEFHAVLGDSKSQALTDILREALRGIAKDRLKDALEENPMLQAVNGSDYTVSALLAWSNDTASSRGSITFTRDQVTEWFKASATKAAAIARNKARGDNEATIAAKLAMLEKRFTALSAKNHGIKESEDADKLITLIAEEDAETGIGSDIIGRLTNISKALKAKKEDKAISMDDL